MTEVGMGHNSVDFDSEQRRALFFTHLNPIWALQQEIDRLQADKTRLKRQAKAEGFESYEVDLAIKIRKTEKPETIDNQMARLMAVARYMSQPVGFQFSFMDGWTDTRPDVDRAYDAGMLQALRGEAYLRNEYDQSLPQHRAMNDGWEDGQKQLREALQKREEAENARKAVDAAPPVENEPAGNVEPRKKRGRPKKITADTEMAA